MPPSIRKRMVWLLWFVTWLGVVAGLFDRVYFEYVVLFSTAHALLVLALLGFRTSTFPAQTRISYLVWVGVGTYVPYAVILMYITAVGLPANLFFGYCPLARLVYLLPWNREEPFSLGLVGRVVSTPPVSGRFKPRLSSG